MSPLWIVLICLAALAVLIFVLSHIAMRLVCCGRGRFFSIVERRMHDATYADLNPCIAEAKVWIRDHGAQEVTTISFDGLSLVGELIPRENARGTLLLFHGWHGSPCSDFGGALPFYYAQGFRILLVHQRAQGKSGGTYMTFGIRERRDVHTWVDWHNARFGADEPVVLGGLSMGATTVLMASGTPFPKNVRGVVADCGFTSPEEIIRAVLRERHLPEWPLLPLIGLQTRLFAGFGLREYSTREAMKTNRLPLFLAHGEADTFVPCVMSRQTFDACTSETKVLLTVPGAVHGRSYLVDREGYEKALLAFLDKILEQ